MFGGFVHSAAAIAVSCFRDFTMTPSTISKAETHSTEARAAHAN